MGRTRLEKQLFEWLDRAVQDRIFPGYAFAVKVGESPVHLGAGGRFTYSPEAPTVTLDTCWDCASLTKVMVTTPLVMRAVDEGLLELDTEVGDIVPESGAARTTIEHLLTHTSGLPPYRDDLPPLGLTPIELRASILATPVQREPGREAVYSCLNFITLQTVLERQVGMSLDDQFEAFVARPAGMTTAGFRPPQPEVCAPTGPVEDWRQRFGERDGRPLPTFERGLQGVVHDPLAWGLGGASGNAGLFASIREIAAWAEWWTRASEAKAREQWARPRFQTTRARGWDTRSEVGSIIPDSWSDGSFGHTGFTGMSLFFDPARSIFVALATNAIFPEGINPRTRWVRHLVHSLCSGRSASE